MKLQFGFWADFRSPAQWRRPLQEIYAEVLDQISFGESLGFDFVCTSEHHLVDDGYGPSPLIQTSAIAARTKRIRVATSVLLAPLYHPVRLAEDCATIDLISGGRFEMGIGIGYRHDECAAYGVNYNERAGRTRECVEIVRRLWAGEALTYRGKYFQIENAKCLPLPAQRPHPPIWIGGATPVGGERAARLGDGFTGLFDLRAIYQAYTDELRALGKDPASGRITGGHLWLIPSEDPHKTFNELAPYVQHQLQEYRQGALSAGYSMFPKLDTLDELKASGLLMVKTPEETVEFLTKYATQVPIERYCTGFFPPGFPAAKTAPYMELYATKVMPHFR